MRLWYTFNSSFNIIIFGLFIVLCAWYFFFFIIRCVWMYRFDHIKSSQFAWFSIFSKHWNDIEDRPAYGCDSPSMLARLCDFIYCRFIKFNTPITVWPDSVDSSINHLLNCIFTVFVTCAAPHTHTCTNKPTGLSSFRCDSLFHEFRTANNFLLNATVLNINGMIKSNEFENIFFFIVVAICITRIVALSFEQRFIHQHNQTAYIYLYKKHITNKYKV